MNAPVRYRWAWFFAFIVALAGCTYVTAVSALTSQLLVFVLALSASSLIISACNSDVFKQLIDDPTTDVVDQTPGDTVNPVDQVDPKLINIGEIGQIYGSVTEIGLGQFFAPGDINGDAIGDVVVMDQYRYSMFVIFGPVNDSVDVDNLGDQGFEVVGDNGGQFMGLPAFGDINGDGKLDIVSTYYNNYASNLYAYTIVAFGKDNTYPVVVDKYDFTVDDGFFIDAAVGKYDGYFGGPQIADFNGDGFDDVVLLGNGGEGKYAYLDRIAVIWGKDNSNYVDSADIYDGDTGFYIFNYYEDGFATPPPFARESAAGVEVLDFNNDGKDDLVLTDKYQDQLFVIFGGDRDQSGFVNDYYGFHSYNYGDENVVPGIAIRQKYSDYDMPMSPDLGIGDFNGDGFDDVAFLGGNKYFDQDHFEYSYGENLEGGDYGWRYLDWEYEGVRSQYMFVVWGTNNPENMNLNPQEPYDYDYDYDYEGPLAVLDHDYGDLYFEGYFEHLHGRASVIQGDFLASVGKYGISFGEFDIFGSYGSESETVDGDRVIQSNSFTFKYDEIEHRDNKNTVEVGDFNGDGVDDLVVQGRPELSINFNDFSDRNWNSRAYIILGSRGMQNTVESTLAEKKRGGILTKIDEEDNYFGYSYSYFYDYSYYDGDQQVHRYDYENYNYDGYLYLDSFSLQGVDDIDGNGKSDIFLTDGDKYGHLVFGGSMSARLDTSDLPGHAGHSFNVDYITGINAGNIDGDSFKEVMIGQYDTDTEAGVIRVFGVLPGE